MYRLKRWALPALALTSLAVAGCGGSSHPKPKPFTVEKVVKAHSTVSPIPQPGERMPAAVVPVPVSAKARAAAHVRRAPVVSRVAAKVRPHVAGARVHFAGDSSTATVEQFDSVTVATIPAWAHYAAGYVDGSWPTYWSIVHRWPVAVGISVSTSHGAKCFDMEPGNPGPQNAGPWARWQFTQGNLRPCEYSMLSWFPQIRASLAAYHVPHCSSATQTRCYLLWDANWTYSRHLDSGYDCTQWTDRAFGLNLDESTCLLSFYGVAKPVHTGPSHAQIVSWANGRAKSIAAYHRYCTRPVLTTGRCGQLGWRVNHYQVLLDKTGKQAWRCFGKHANRGAAICQIVRPAVAVWSSARSATRSAEAGCFPAHGRELRTAFCRSLDQRYRYFDHRASRTVATSRY